MRRPVHHLEPIDAAADQGDAVHERGKVPRVAGEAQVGEVEVQQAPVAVAGDHGRVHLERLGAQSPRAEAHRPSHDAADPIGPDHHAGAERTVRRLDDRTLARGVGLQPVDPHAVAHLDAARARDPGERIVELPAPHDATDRSGRGHGRGAHAMKRDAVDGDRGHVGNGVEPGEDPVAARAEGTGAGLVARVAALLEDDDTRCPQRRRMRERERRGDPGGTASNDDDVGRAGRHGAYGATTVPSESVKSSDALTETSVLAPLASPSVAAGAGKK